MQIIKEKRPLRLVKPAVSAPRGSAATNHGKLAAGNDGYYERIKRYARQIRQTDNVTEIINILDVALLETRALHTQDEVREARERLQRAEQKIEALKDELE